MRKCNKVIFFLYFLILTSLAFLSANCFLFIFKTGFLWSIPIALAVFLIINIIPSLTRQRFPSAKLRLSYHGIMCLGVFLASAVLSVIYHIASAFVYFPSQWYLWAISAVICIFVESVLFWNGIISVYTTSTQLGIKIRVIGILCGFIPIANIIALSKIIKTVANEVDFECNKAYLDLQRQSAQICRTRYPLLLVHGVFFRDHTFPNYWGRIPDELKKNGAVIFYGNQQSAASVKNSGRELSERIKQIVQETGAEKVNIIAHSKGGLDSRWAINTGDTAKYVASLTTINTPHHGCEFADYLLDKIPVNLQKTVEGAYNGAMRRFGDYNPDFMSAVRDLTADSCKRLNDECPDSPYVYYQSVGSKLDLPSKGKFPLNFTYRLVNYFDGANDGLVSEKSLVWGSNHIFLTTNGKRGISHGDVVDLNRENIEGFDVREFYVQLVNNLKINGY